MTNYNLRPRKRKYDDILTDINDDKLRIIKNKIKNRRISYNCIMKLDLPEDELIWFVEHIQILEHIPEYTEDHYRIKNMIYNKYREFVDNSQNIKNIKILYDLKKFVKLQSDIITRICESHHSNYIKGILYKKYQMLSNSDKSEEYFKIIEWIDTILDLPTIQPTIPSIIQLDIDNILIKLRANLNDKIFGLENTKEKIIESYCAMLTNLNYKKKIISLVGPPGVGKTALAKVVAESLNQSFSQISFGGIKDPHVLTGFPLTYIGSRPGEFVNILRRTKKLDTLILLDEIDKIPNSVEGHSISSVLLNVLDKTQNDHFQDMYIPEIPINLSFIFFIVAMNSEEFIDPILKDRLCIIKIEGYNIEEKIIIGKNYILPRILSELKFKQDDIKIDDTIMKYIIQYNNIQYNTQYNVGIRDLERDISNICEKINVLRHTQNKKFKLSYSFLKLKFPVNVNKYMVDTLLKN